MKKTLLFFSLFIFLITLWQCSDDTSIIDDNETDSSDVITSSDVVVDSSLGFVVKVYDNTLCFDSAKDVIAALTILHEMSSAERREWEVLVGFESAQTLLEDLQTESENIEDDDEFAEFIEKNNELIIESSNSPLGFKSRIYGYYPCITGKNGLFVSEYVWCKVFDGKLYSANDFDRDGYLFLCNLAVVGDTTCSSVRSITVDFNWDNDKLKSYHSDLEVTETKITIEQYNYTAHNPTKKSIFEMELINNYTTRSLSSGGYVRKYYLIVYYDTNCCDPSDYSYTYAGRTYRFFRLNEGEWIIYLPYETYLDDYPFDNPNWDDEMIGSRLFSTVRYYNYYGNVDLNINFQAYKRGIRKFKKWDGTIVWFKNVSGKVKLGKNLTGHSSAITTTFSGLGDNYLDLDEDGDASTTQIVYTRSLTEYSSQPQAVFTDCVSGTICSRFCPETYNFSFTSFE